MGIMGTALHIVQLPPLVKPLASKRVAFVSRKKRRSDPSIQSVERAAAILRSFVDADTELGVTALSHQLGIHKSTVSRLLATLQHEGFVERNPETGKYRLGLGLITLASTALERLDLRRAAQPYLSALAESTQETVNITVLDGDECVNIERITSPKSIRYVGWIGRRTPLHCTSTGKVLLAYLTPNERDALLPETLSRLTEKTITDRTALEQTLEQVRQQGYAIAHEELEEGLSAIAAPIRDRTGRVVATVSISGPTYRIEPVRIEHFAEPLKQTASDISARLGHVTAFDNGT